VEENNSANGGESITARRGLGGRRDAPQANKSPGTHHERKLRSHTEPANPLTRQKETSEMPSNIRSRTAGQGEKLRDVEREMSEITSDENVEMMDLDAVPGEDVTADQREIQLKETRRDVIPELSPRNLSLSGNHFPR